MGTKDIFAEGQPLLPIGEERSPFKIGEAIYYLVNVRHGTLCTY